MLQLAYNWRIAGPIQALQTRAAAIQLRGNLKTEPVAIPAHIKKAIDEKRIRKAISVGDLTFKNCPTRRDFYLSLHGEKGADTWSRHAGHLAESFFFQLLDDDLSDTAREPRYSYASLRKAAEAAVNKLSAGHKKRVSSLQALEPPTGDKSWFTNALTFAGMHELAIQELALSLDEAKQPPMKAQKLKIAPAESLGIAGTNEPDFIFPDLRIVGDMKTGPSLQPSHLLTCAGYALAYESQFPDKQIDFGLVYFFSTYRSAISLPQVFAFVIDDDLRSNFLEVRNASYDFLLRNQGAAPPFPKDTSRCPTCKFRSYCEGKGLEIT